MGEREVEAFSGRERIRGPRHARFSRGGVEEREPAAEIPSKARELICPGRPLRPD